MTPVTQKVGRFTVAIGLITFGAALLTDNLTANQGATALVIKFWPLLLIGFGLEYLIRSFLSQRNQEESRLRFDAGGLFLLALVVVISMGVHTFRGWVVPNSGRLSFAGPQVEVTETEQVAVDAATEELDIDVSVGSVLVEPSSRADQLLVEATYSAYGFIINRDDVHRQLEQIRLNVTDGRVVRVAVDTPNQGNGVMVRLVIYAPQNLKVKVHTGTGSIDLRGYQGETLLNSQVGRIAVTAGSGPLTAGSGSGSVVIHNHHGPVNAQTNVGTIEIQNAIGSVQADSGTGSIHIQEFQGGTLVAQTRTGSVTVASSSPLEGDVNLKTQTGRIDLTIPAQSSIQATAKTGTGSLTTPDFMPVTRSGTASSAVGTSGEGTHTISLEAHTGSVTFTTQ